MKNTILLSILFSSIFSFAQSTPQSQTWIITDLALLKTLGIQPLMQNEALGFGSAQVNEFEKGMIHSMAHARGRCGGFEVFDDQEALQANMLQMQKLVLRNHSAAPMRAQSVVYDANIAAALEKVDPQNLRTTVEWLSSFHNRYFREKQPNQHVEELAKKLEDMMKVYAFPFSVEIVRHKKIPQNSLRLKLVGHSRPDEIVVLGAHLDSINSTSIWGSTGYRAPGADDNASGSANLVEALRVFVEQKIQPEKSIELFWYAGEEGGLLGSGEIATEYKQQSKNIVGVLQLDMTLYPGAGEFTLGSMTDFTSPILRQYLADINQVYLKVKIVEDECGYGCSDHASWFRQGYPTVMPFEATFNGMNQNIHTDRDIINTNSSFQHSAVFSKIALLFMMDF